MDELKVFSRDVSHVSINSTIKALIFPNENHFFDIQTYHFDQHQHIYKSNLKRKISNVT